MQSELDIEVNVVLIHDGVIGTSKKAETPESLRKLLNLPINVFAIIPDIKARGMDPNNILEEIKGIKYGKLVDLLVDTHKIVSWM